MTPSAFIYIGALVVVMGLTLPLFGRGHRKRGMMRGLLLALFGIGFVLLGLGFPFRDQVVQHPRVSLDAMMPRYLFNERHSVTIAATPLDVDSAIRAVTTREIRFYQTLTWVRRLGRRGPESLINAPPDESILVLATRTGFHLLVDDPGSEIVFGAAGAVSPAARGERVAGTLHPFVASSDGYVSIVMNFHIAPGSNRGSVLSTETRVFAPDAATRRQLATYWRLIYPGSALIRRGWLHAIKRRAEEPST